MFGHAGSFAANIDLSDLDGANGFQLSGGDPSASDPIVGGPGADDLEGDIGNDLIRGRGGDDLLVGQ